MLETNESKIKLEKLLAEITLELILKTKEEIDQSLKTAFKLIGKKLKAREIAFFEFKSDIDIFLKKYNYAAANIWSWLCCKRKY